MRLAKRSNHQLRRAALLAAALLFTVSGSGAHAVPGDGVNDFYGSYHSSVPIGLPQYASITPALALTYSSSAGNGIVGVGWDLTGFSTIERMSSGRGAPAFDDSDVYVLDGQELVADTGLGGTHATLVQSYVRIIQDKAANTWTVISKDGTRSLYRSTYGVTPRFSVDGSTPEQTLRWGLSSITDASGNVVRYGWHCDAEGPDYVITDCYPRSVGYKYASAYFYWEDRSDPISFATGKHIGRTSKRLKTVSVTSKNKRVAAYELIYKISEATGRSVLLNVKRYGTDAVIDADTRTVTDGTALPTISLGSQTTVATGAAPAVGHVYEPVFILDSNPWIYPGDYNGDGRQDLLYLHKDYVTHGWRLMAGLDSGFAAPVTWQAYEAVVYTRTSGAWIYPGDYNGDGKRDLLYLAKSYSTLGWRLMVGGVNTAAAPVTWHAYEPVQSSSARPWVYPGDYDGDGKQDLLYLDKDYRNRGWRLLASLGDRAAMPVTWQAYEPINFSEANGIWMYPGDYNGDGKQDLLYLHKDYSRYGWRLMAGEGRSGAPPVTFHAYERLRGSSWGVWMYPGDYNGDGKQDLLYLHDDYSTYGWRLVASQGVTGASPVTFHTYEHLFGNSRGAWIHPGDYNGDGKQDLLYLHKDFSTHGWRLLASLGDSAAAPTTWRAYEPAHGRAWIHQGDYNGDAKTDLLYLHNAFTVSGWRFVPALGGADVLTSIVSGDGGETTVEYAPSSMWANTNNPPIVRTVTKVSESDGRGNTSSASYHYAGGLFDRDARRLLGFHETRETMPCLVDEENCPYEITEWVQDYGSVSKPRRIDQFDGDGRLLASALFKYTTNGNEVPYTSNETEAWVYVYDGESVRRSSITRTFDEYGNITQEVNWGDYDIAGDEKTIRYYYPLNSETYLVGKPSVIETFFGTTTMGTLLAQALTYYDDATDWRTPPTRGLPTKSLQWLNTTNSYVVTSATYDERGNVVTETNALGHTVRYEFDDAHRFVTSTTNELGHEARAEWDPVCGVRTKLIDINNKHTTYEYDALCRLIRTDAPGGEWETRRYHDYVDRDQTAYVEVRGPSADGDGDQWSQSYSDGFGRNWRTVTKGPGIDQPIYSDTEYNARGSVARTTQPYYATDAPLWTHTRYDAQDRPVERAHPDGRSSKTSYGLGTITYTDEAGHMRIETRDIEGHVVERKEQLGDRMLVTT